MKQKQRDEVSQLVGEVSPEQKQEVQLAKQEMLRQFWSQAPDEDVPF
ncbi:hypothetical protein [Anabaena azotica]|nr:hypothetical protein [Anabaena azotica]